MAAYLIRRLWQMVPTLFGVVPSQTKISPLQ